MTPHLPAVIDKEVIRVLRKLGFKLFRRTRTGHEVYRRDADGCQTTIPRHAGKAIKRKTLKSILESVGLSVEEFNLLRRGKKPQ